MTLEYISMDLNDIFDETLSTLKSAASRHVHIDLAKESQAPSEDLKPPEKSGALDGDLPEKVANVVRAAAAAHDAVSEAKAAYNVERSRLQEEMDDSLDRLVNALKTAQEVGRETRKVLEAVMGAEGITNIPMTDRPDVMVKTSKGKKGRITKGWLCKPNGPVSKAYGVDAGAKIWAFVPNEKDKREIIIPDRYEDEPDHA